MKPPKTVKKEILIPISFRHCLLLYIHKVIVPEIYHLQSYESYWKSIYLVMTIFHIS